MNKYLASMALLTLAACTKKDNTTDPPVTPPKTTDTTKLEVSVYDATQWSATDPVGKLRSGVTVTLYKSQDDYNAKQKAYETTTDVNGKASFSNVPAMEYYIVAQLDTLSSTPVAVSTPLKGYLCDSLYQTMPALSNVPANVDFPYPGSFVFRDLNADGKLDQNDMVRLPADHIKADSAKITSARILIGVKENCNYKPFADNAALKTELDNIYNEVHTWHQLQAVYDAVYTDDANCAALPGWCDINSYKITAADQHTAALWNNAYAIISRTNRILSTSMTPLGISTADEKTIRAEATVIRAYVYEQLVAMFNITLQGTTICLPLHITPTNAAASRTLDFTVFQYAKDALPHISSAVTNRSHLSYEACLALYARAAWDHNSDDLLAAAATTLQATDGFKADPVKDGAYKASSSPENLWCDTRVISNTDLKSIFLKGNYAPEIHYAEIILLQAVYFASVDKFDDVATRINILRTRNNTTTVAKPATRKEAIGLIQQQYKTELAMEGLTLNHIIHKDALAGGADLVVPRLMPLPGFSPMKIMLPIPLSTINLYAGVYQNPGY
jgi:starch-binding outer membrane protein, SusD/RagB family